MPETANDNALDYAQEVRAIAAHFEANPDYGAAETREILKTYAGDQRHYWTAPEGFYGAHDLRSIFSEIYSRGVWGGGSGSGSNIEKVLLYAGYVLHLIRRLGARRIVDLGCGDWRFTKFIDLSGCDYLGVDVVPSVIEANTAAYASSDGTARIRFVCADVTTFAIPPCDLLLCKDVLQHLSNANVSAVLARTSVARAALITNDYHPINKDCANGDTRPLDPTAPPFNWNGKPRLAFLGKFTFLAER